MKYLIDTCVLVWWLVDYDKMPRKIFRILMDSQNEIFVSLISFWEISLKYSVGKLGMRNVEPNALPGYVRKSGFSITGLQPDVVASSYKLKKLGHKDPFDRLLVWEAINGGYTLLSSDESLKGYEAFGLKLFN